MPSDVSSVPAPPWGGGKEELRASILRPYLLRLREEHGESAMRALLSNVGLSPTVIEDESLWISVAAARRALGAIAATLGEGSLTSRDQWITHPENLGTYVRLLRTAHQPIEAYQYLARFCEQATRVGTYDIDVLSPLSVRMTYSLRADDEPSQKDRLFCDARAGELAGMPRLWGLDDAKIVHERCVARGDASCAYIVSWQPFTPPMLVPLVAGTGALISAGSVAFSGGWISTAVAALIGGGLGGVIGWLGSRMRRERAARTLDRHRISALERGLAMRGDSDTSPGELVGMVLGGKYRITRKIGSGGIGAVYQAEHIALGSQVAIKVLRGAAAKDASEVARLRREAQVQVSIEHPNVIRTLDLDQMPDGSIYVVMELLRGESLADRLGSGGVLAPGTAIPVFVQVCRALSAAHDKGVIHRDLKPGNIFLCEDGTAKVLDFGMSKFAAAETLTQEGYTLGTPEYMAPEQCIGAPVEPRTDLYAFGVLMYEALTGELPILARNRRQLLELQQRYIPPPMRERRADLDIPEALDRVVMKTLRKSADDRPSNAAELEQMLLAIPTENLPKSYPPALARTRSSNPVERPRRAR